nr:rhomboid family intramembrane serine protease [Aquabacter spiritensis]
MRAYVRAVQEAFPPRRPPARQPAFNVPGPVLALGAALAVIELVRSFLGDGANLDILALFAFIPARYDAASQIVLPGGLAADLWTFVTYALLHGNWVHLIVNLVWLLAFGSPVARRFGPVRFALFCAATAIAGALAHLLAYPGALVPMIGASAVVSGAMAAAVRFAFSPGGALGPASDRRGRHPPAVPLLTALREPRVLVFIGVWVGLNILFGVAVEVPGSSDAEIAWQAHMGGFFAGLLLFSFFDPPPRNRPHAAAEF